MPYELILILLMQDGKTEEVWYNSYRTYYECTQEKKPGRYEGRKELVVSWRCQKSLNKGGF